MSILYLRFLDLSFYKDPGANGGSRWSVWGKLKLIEPFFFSWTLDSCFPADESRCTVSRSWSQALCFVSASSSATSWSKSAPEPRESSSRCPSSPLETVSSVSHDHRLCSEGHAVLWKRFPSQESSARRSWRSFPAERLALQGAWYSSWDVCSPVSPQTLPPSSCRTGSCKVSWFETCSGFRFIKSVVSLLKK